MQFIYKIPGYILILFGGFCLSWGGFIVRLFETSNAWEILLLRSIFFFLGVSVFLFLIYKKDIVKTIKNAGLLGLLGGFVMSFSYAAFVFAMMNTTVANVLFIISTQTIFLAIFGFFYLKEKVSLIGFLSIVLAMSGVGVMIGDAISTGNLFGNLVALILPISFSTLIMIVRKNPNLDFFRGSSTSFWFYLYNYWFKNNTISDYWLIDVDRNDIWPSLGMDFSK